jgi:Lon protease-like protein
MDESRAASGAGAAPPAALADLREDFDCSLCHSLLYEPVCLLCGHSYCRPCIRRALAHTQACPLCRAQCFLEPANLTPNFLLSDFIARAFPEEARSRQREQREVDEELNSSRLGLFFLSHTGDLLWPGMPVELHVYEPRYLLLMRRCSENNCMFGICPDATSSRGAAVRIDSLRPLPHNRLAVSARVVTRFRTRGPPAAAEPGTYGLYYTDVQFYEDEPLRNLAAANVRAADDDEDDNDEEEEGAEGEGAGAARRQRIRDTLPAGEGDEALPELAQLLPRSSRTLRALTEPQACTLLRDTVAETVLRLVASLPPAASFRLQGQYGAPPSSSGTGASPERWSNYAAAVVALPREARAAAFQTRRTLRRLLICYAALEGLERRIRREARERERERERHREGEGQRGGAAADADAPEPEDEIVGPSGLSSLSSLDAGRALEMLAPTQGEGRLSALYRAVSNSAAFTSLMILAALVVALVLLRAEGGGGVGLGGGRGGGGGL